MKKNVASQSVGAQMITAADGTPFTGAVSVLYTLDNGTQTAGGNASPAHEGNGYHSYTPLQAETNGDHIAYTFTGTGAIPATVQLFTTFPQTVDNNTLLSSINSNYSTFNPDTDTVATVATVTNMRGTDNALLSSNYSSPDNTSIASILADTNELQLNQGNWLTATGFSTFNPGLDEVAKVALVTANSDMRGTDGANTVVPPSVVQFNARTLPSTSYSQFDYTVNEVNSNLTKINGVAINGDGGSIPFDV